MSSVSFRLPDDVNPLHSRDCGEDSGDRGFVFRLRDNKDEDAEKTLLVFSVSDDIKEVTPKEDKKTKSAWLAYFRGGPLDGEWRNVKGYAPYRSANGEGQVVRESKLAGLIGAVESCDGIYCLTDDGNENDFPAVGSHYRWVYSSKNGKRADEIAFAEGLAKKQSNTA